MDDASFLGARGAREEFDSIECTLYRECNSSVGHFIVFLEHFDIYEAYWAFFFVAFLNMSGIPFRPLPSNKFIKNKDIVVMPIKKKKQLP